MKVKQFTKFLRAIGLFAIALFLSIFLTHAPRHIPATNSQIKGIWLTHIGNAGLTYSTRIDNAFHQLSQLNFNRVYVDVYNGGTTYPSRYSPRNYLVSLPLTDPLKTSIRQGKRQGLNIYAWYEHGMMVFPDARLARQHPNWILKTQQGQQTIDSHWWLDPENEEVQHYFVNLFTEVARQYSGLSGIQLDDHWGIPLQFGNKTLAMTKLTRKVVAAIDRVRPDLEVSLSPNPLGFAKKKYAQDWLAWVKEGLIEEVVIQVYRPHSKDVLATLNSFEFKATSQYVPLGIGIYTGSWRRQPALSEIQKQISAVKQSGYGYALFCWESSFSPLRRASRQQKESYLK
jgi:uncharacterized lipoprotein YddW (UPF0748 family)